MELNPKTNSWLLSSKSYHLHEENSKIYLTAYLYDLSGNIVKNKIVLHPLLEHCYLNNINGILEYSLTREEDEHIMNKLFPTYIGETIDKIEIKECVILSVDSNKYNKARNETIGILNQYNIPKISTYFGFTNNTVSKSKFYDCTHNKNIRSELICGMLEIFNNFVLTSKDNQWLLYFEDDVRPVNIDTNENLKFLYNIPKDAELIRPYIGYNHKCRLEDIQYKQSYGGGYAHAFYISSKGCKKVINYAQKYGWKYNCDIDLYQISKFNQEIPSGYIGWSFEAIDGSCDNVKVDSEDEKLFVYHMDHIIFNQTSLPCAPFLS